MADTQQGPNITDAKKAAHGNAAKPSLKFEEMTRRQKIVFVTKVTLCVISFGFIYPTIMND